MTLFIIFALLLIALGSVLYVAERVHVSKHGERPVVEPDPEETACADDSCSLIGACPTEMILQCTGKPVEYYDDEELDAYKDRDPQSYTEDEVEQFRDILYTLQPTDYIGWEQSIKRRGIALPQPIHDEFMMLYADAQRQSAGTQKNAVVQ